MQLWTLIFLILTISIDASAQSACPQAPVLGKPDGENIFDEQQESYLGEVVAESIAQSLRIMEEVELAGPLKSIGDRVLRQMPQSKLNHRFFLVDAPVANAYALPGGRVYVTRKLILSCHSEDELAGVLAHEIGHQLKHDTAVQITREFDKLLKITSVGDHEDIENKYHQLLDSYRKKSRSIDTNPEKEQYDADQVALFAMARAGYDPQVMVDYWYRFTERKGRKGGWLYDVFGSTAPETKRLREFAKVASQIPAACREPLQSESQTDFEKWKNALLYYKGFGKKAAVPGLLVKETLEPPLRGEINHFRFSPDGRYLLAQDEASIFVLQRDPLKMLFRIEARDANPGHFTPDSAFVAFHNEALQVHKHSVAEQREVEVHDVYVFGGCLRSQLSPDGSVLACFKPDADNFMPVGIRLIDVATGDVIYDKKDFVDLLMSDIRGQLMYLRLSQEDGDNVTMSFSSDGRFFLAGMDRHTWGFDFKDKKELKLPGSLKSIMETSFAFLGPDRLVGVAGERGDNSKIVRVPSGDVLQSGLKLGPVALQAANVGEFVVVRPLIETPAGIMDLKENKIFLASKTEALDIHDGVWVGERTTGEVALYRRSITGPIAAVTLPRSPLGTTRAITFSSDLNLLAISDRTRGKIWDFSKGSVLTLGGFRGACFDNNTALINFAPPSLFRKRLTEGVSEKELSKEVGKQQGNAIARIDLAKPAMTEVARYQKWQRVYQIGSTYALLLPKRPEDDEYRDVTLEVHDFQSNLPLWSRFFKRLPMMGWNTAENIVVLAWELTEPGAKDEIRQDPEAARLVESIPQRDESYFVVALETHTGKPVARFPINTGKGSYHIVDVHPSGEYLVFQDNHDRLLVYNLRGQRIGRFFGRNPAVSSKTEMLAVEREPGRIALYSLSTGSKQREFTFNGEVEYAQFSADGRRLAVVTRNQDVYFVDVSDLVQSQSR